MYRLSTDYRVSKYCVECERGFVSKARVSTQNYLNALNKIIYHEKNKILNRIL